MVVLIGPPALLLGVFDAVARLSDYPLLRVVDALLIALLALVWIVPITSFMLFLEPDIFGNVDTAPWQTCLGYFIGQEFSLALLVIFSVMARRVARRPFVP